MSNPNKNIKAKPTHIEAYFQQAVRFDIEDYEIDLDDIEHMYVRWCTLHIILKSGKEIQVNDYHEYDIDWKYPEKSFVYDDMCNELDEF